MQIGYDFYGNVTSKISRAKPGSGLPDISESTAIDAGGCGVYRVLCFRTTSYTDGLGRTTNYAYDTAGRLTTELSPPDASGVRIARYLSYGASFTAPTVVRVCGVGTTCGTAAETRTEYTYLGNTALPLTETRFDGTAGTSLTTSYGYDAAGRVLWVDGPLPGTDDATYNRYDVLGRKTWEIGPRMANGHRATRRFTYRDSDDKVVATEVGALTDPNGTALQVYNRTDVAYDARRNPVRETLSAAGVAATSTDRSFDDRGRLVCEAQRMNPAAFGATADACAQGTAGSFGPDRITRNSYDAASQLLKVERGVGTPLRQDYATYAYTANGKRASVTDANGNPATMTYDGFDRQVRWTFPSAAAPGTVNAGDYEGYGYDAAGNRTSLRRRDGGTIGYGYDGLNRVTVKSVPGSATGAPGYSVHYGYDARGLQLYARFGGPGGEGVTSAYDGYGRLVSSITAMGGVSRTLGYLYDAAGNRARVTHPDGTWFRYEYDAAGLLQRFYDQDGGQLDAWGYDGLGRLATTFGGGQQWGRDEIGRLTGLRTVIGAANDETMRYNPAGQVVEASRSNNAYAFGGYVNVSRAYATNGLNQYTSAGPASFTYDPNGNLTGDGTSGYRYDAENRLVGTSGGAALAYDPLGRLWRVSGPGGATEFLTDGDEVVAEYGGQGQVLRRYVHGTGPDDPHIWYEGAGRGDIRYLMSDRQGSIVQAMGGNFQPVAVNTYDEYGIPGPGNAGRFGYTGQMWLPELGLWHYKARVYSPTLGRFLQTDPIGYDDQVNLYAYVGNDPVNNADPTGTECGSLIAGHIGAGCSGASTLNIMAQQAANATPPGQQQGNVGQGGRSTPPPPDPAAEGRPHTRIQSPGPDGRYTTYDKHGPVKQYRGEPGGRGHGNVPRPNVKEWARNTGPDGRTYPGRPTVRAPTPGEIPGRPPVAAAGGAAGVLSTIIRWSPLGLLLMLSGDTPRDTQQEGR